MTKTTKINRHLGIFLSLSTLLLTTSCSPKPPEKPLISTPAPTSKPEPDFFAEGVKSAIKASDLAKTAKTPQELNNVALAWLEAVTYMQKVPPGSPKRTFAQKKVVEYLQNYVRAQQKAAQTNSKLDFPTFNSELLDQQLNLYLSYIAAVGKPDILIVGSSRALQGVDVKNLQQALTEKGYPGIKIYNFSVNGATAKVINFLLTQLLTPEQLPRLIVWADGVRAFNSGRPDRTYQAIANSPGYQSLLAGIRPHWQPASFKLATNIKPQQIESTYFHTSTIDNSLNTQKNQTYQSFIYAQNWQKTTPEIPLDSNGFSPILEKFEPKKYYQKNPKVSGEFDGDYIDFNLRGEQAEALKQVVNFSKQKNIPLIVINLPLTADYLDKMRKKAEQEFINQMQHQAEKQGFIFRNLSLPELRKNEYFQDPSHINSYGAAAVSRKLATDTTIPWPKP